jgi:MFS family permease
MAVQFAVGGAVIPFVTLFFRDRGLDFGQISFIFTASSATLLVFPFLWGMLADRVVPLNRLFIVLNLLSCAALALLGHARSFPAILVAYTCFFACFNPTLYLMNALCFHHLADPREQFGIVRAWGSLGWIVPFLPISLWLARGSDGDLGFVLYLGMACSLLMTGLSFWLPHTPPGGHATAHPIDAPAARRGGGAYREAIRELLLDSNYIVLLLSMFLMAGSFSLLTYYSPALLQDIGVPRPWIGPIQAIGVVFEIVLFQWQPALIRRWGFVAVILTGCVALSLRHLLFGLVENAWILSASYLLAGMVIVFYNQGVSILVNAMAAREVRATAQTLLLLFGQGLGPLFANGVTGRFAAHTGNRLTHVFLFAAALAALASLLISGRARQLNRAGRGGG